MSRPKEFDEQAALDAALQCFWFRGYEATSVRVLARRMGITGASLYNAFGDKRRLFRTVLDRYLDLGLRNIIARHEPNPLGRSAIIGFMAEVIDGSVNDTERRGCLIVNSCLELAPHDPEFRAIIDAAFGEIEDFFRRCLDRGCKDGSIASGNDPETLAKPLLSIVLAVRVMARTRPDRTILEGMSAPILALL